MRIVVTDENLRPLKGKVKNLLLTSLRAKCSVSDNSGVPYKLSWLGLLCAVKFLTIYPSFNLSMYAYQLS